MSSFFLLVFSSSWHLQPKYINNKNRQNGNYQVAVKKNNATIDNRQDVELITKLLSGNISRQPRWASQPTVAHSPSA
jgi:hypothetical protein